MISNQIIYIFLAQNMELKLFPELSFVWGFEYTKTQFVFSCAVLIESKWRENCMRRKRRRWAIKRQLALLYDTAPKAVNFFAS